MKRCLPAETPLADSKIILLTQDTIKIYRQPLSREYLRYTVRLYKLQ